MVFTQISLIAKPSDQGSHLDNGQSLKCLMDATPYVLS